MATARNAAMSFNRLVDRRIDADNPRYCGSASPFRSTFCAIRDSVYQLQFGRFRTGNTAVFATKLDPVADERPGPAVPAGLQLRETFHFVGPFLARRCINVGPAGCLGRDSARVFPGHRSFSRAAVMFWVAGFDIIYACQDVEFDRKTRLHSVPARWGVARSLRIAMLCHAVMLALLALLPLAFPSIHAGFYYLGFILIAILLGVEHYLVRPDDLERVNIAFFHVNAVVSVGLFLTVFDLSSDLR